MLIGIVIVTVLLALWLLAPQPKDRATPLTERQQRAMGRLAELDAARIVLIAELGMEPTAAELWNVSPPKDLEA